MKNKLVKSLATIIAMSMIFTGCGGSETSTDTSGQGASGGTEASEDGAFLKTFNRASTRAAATASPHQATSGPDFEITRHIIATPYIAKLGDDLMTEIIVPELAEGEPVDVNGDGLTWNIKIKADQKWENGDPITVDTMMYSYKMILDPVLLNPTAGQFAENYIKIANAKDYFTQATTDSVVAWEDVGIKKIDDTTMQFVLSEVSNAANVMRQMTLRYYAPVHETTYEEHMNDDRTATLYGTSQETTISSGAFSLVHWTKGAERKYEKNDNYALADLVNLDEMTYKVVEDSGTQMQMFESGELDVIELSTDGVTKYSEDPRRATVPHNVIRHIDLNINNETQPILNNLNFRKAMYYGVNREEIADLTNMVPAPYYVSNTSIAYADGTSFRDIPEASEYLPENYGYDSVKAKEYFDLALEETGIDKVTLGLNYTGTIAETKIMSEYLQKSYAAIFGEDKFELVLQALPNAQHLDVMKSFQTDSDSYELAWSGWGWSAGNNSPNRTFEVLVSDFGRRNAPYNNEAFDELYRESVLPEVKIDEKRVAELTMEMEKIYIEEVMSIPVIEAVRNYMVSERVVMPNGVMHSTLLYGLAFADVTE